MPQKLMISTVLLIPQNKSHPAALTMTRERLGQRRERRREVAPDASGVARVLQLQRGHLRTIALAGSSLRAELGQVDACLQAADGRAAVADVKHGDGSFGKAEKQRYNVTVGSAVGGAEWS